MTQRLKKRVLNMMVAKCKRRNKHQIMGQIAICKFVETCQPNGTSILSPTKQVVNMLAILCNFDPNINKPSQDHYICSENLLGQTYNQAKLHKASHLLSMVVGDGVPEFFQPGTRAPKHLATKPEGSI